MATFDVLAGRLTIDNAGFLNGLKTAGAAAQRFAAQINQAFRGIGEPKAPSFGKLAEGLNGAAKAARELTESLDKPLLGAKSKLEAVAKTTQKIGKIAAGGSGLAKWAAQIVERSKAALLRSGVFESGDDDGRIDAAKAKEEGKYREAGATEYLKNNPAQAAQADAAVNNAAQGTNAAAPPQPPGSGFFGGRYDKGPKKDSGKSMSELLANFLSGGVGNVKVAMQNQYAVNRTLLGWARGSVNGKTSGAQQAGYNALAALGQRILREMEQVSHLEGDAQKQQIANVTQLNDLLHRFSGAVKDGSMKLGDMADEVDKATKDVDKLAQAAADEAAQRQGKLTPTQQAAQQNQQQFQQQVQNWWNQQMQQGQQQFQQAVQQAGQQAWDSGQAMLSQALGGPQQIQDLIDKAAATGHMKDAIRLIRQRIEAQLEQSKLNLHGLATNLDPNAGSFGSMPGVSNEAYLMTQDIPLVRLIKYLQAELASLPKMASGGIITGPTNIIAGEAGPEAVLPLNNFWNMMGSLPVFQGIRSAMESIGTWFSEGGNNPALAAKYFANLDQVQHVYEYSLDALRNSRSVNFTPASRLGGPPAGGGPPGAIGMLGRAAFSGGLPFGAGGYAGPMFPIGAMNLYFNGVDITAPGAAAQFAQQLLPALDAEARRAGYSMMGGSMLRAGYGNSANRAFGYPR